MENNLQEVSLKCEEREQEQEEVFNTPPSEEKSLSQKKRRGAPIKKGLRKPQIILLQTLSQLKKPVTKKQLAELAGVDVTKIGEYAGPRPPGRTEKASLRYPFPDLHTLGLVKIQKLEGFPAICSITTKGREFLMTLAPNTEESNRR